MIFIDNERIDPRKHKWTKKIWDRMVEEYPGIVDPNQPPVTIVGKIEASYDRHTGEQRGTTRRHAFYMNKFMVADSGEHEICFSKESPTLKNGKPVFPASQRTILINGSTPLVPGRDAEMFFYLLAFSGQVADNWCQPNYRSNTITLKIVSYEKNAAQDLENIRKRESILSKASGEWSLEVVKAVLRSFNVKTTQKTENILRMDLINLVQMSGKRGIDNVNKIENLLANESTLFLYSKVQGLVENGEITFDKNSSYWRQVDPITHKLGANIVRSPSFEGRFEALRTHVRNNPGFFEEIVSPSPQIEGSPEDQRVPEQMGTVVV